MHGYHLRVMRTLLGLSTSFLNYTIILIPLFRMIWYFSVIKTCSSVSDSDNTSLILLGRLRFSEKRSKIGVLIFLLVYEYWKISPYFTAEEDDTKRKLDEADCFGDNCNIELSNLNCHSPNTERLILDIYRQELYQFYGQISKHP